GIRDRNVTGVQTCALPILKEVPLKKKRYQILHTFYVSSPSNINISSIGSPNSEDILNASSKEGLYFPTSIATIDWRDTPTAFAKASCVHFCSFRNSLILFFTFVIPLLLSR